MTNLPALHPILRPLGRYLLALGLVGLGLGLCWSMPQVLAPRPFLAFWPMVVVAAEFGGKGSGVFATVASALCVNLILSPAHSWLNLHDWVGLAAVGIFLAGGLAISVFIGGKRKLQSLQRRQAADVAASEARYRSVFEAANVGKSVTRPTGEIEVNQAFCDMLGYSPEELRCKTWQELTPAEEIGPTSEQLALLMRGEKNAVRFEKRYLHKLGSPVWADVSVTVQRDQEGHPLHFIVTVVDITERKRVEAALRQKADELRASNVDLEHFNRAMVGREMRMIELKREINELCRRLGEPPRHGDQARADRPPGGDPTAAEPGERNA